MESQGKRWIVRDAGGHIYGPFNLTKMKELLLKGTFSGEEQVAQYPAGEWGSFSTEKELYDLVLEALTIPRSKKAISPKPADETVKKAQASEAQPHFRDSLGETKVRVLKASKGSSSKKKESAPPPIIELIDKKLIEKGRRNFLPVVLIVLAVGLLLFAFMKKSRRSQGLQAINLLSPQIQKKNDPARSQALVSKGWGYFYKDTFTNYIRAEETFVQAVEESPNNVDAIVMLLMTDLELWPYAKQDGADQNVIQSLLLRASRADTYGPRRELASALVDIMLDHEANARSQLDSSLVSQPSEGRLYYLKALMYFNSSDFQQAANYYEKAATLMPYWVKPIYMLGVCYSKQASGIQAQQFLAKALQMNPNHAAARLEIGLIDSQYVGNDTKALEDLNVALSSEERLLPTIEARGRLMLALIYNKTGEINRAKREAERALKLSPGNPTALELLNRLGDKKFAEELSGDDKQHMLLGDQYLRMNNFLGAQAQYKAAFELNPRNARAALKTAEALWKLHQPADAIEYLQKATVADPKLVEAYVVLADYRSRRFDFDGALRALELALKINSKSYEVYRGYGLLLSRKGDAVGAEAYIKKALQIYETDVTTNQLMASVQLMKKDIVKAVQYAKRAVDLDQTNVEAQVTYAKVIVAYEGIKEATAYVRDLANNYPSKPEYRVALAEILIQDEQYPAARELLEQVVAANDQIKEAYMLLGDACFFSNNLDDALTNYLSASRVDPSDPAGVFRAGEVYLKAGRPADAQKQFQSVIKMNALFPRAHYSLARALYNQGLGDLALKELDEEKKMNPKLADPYEFSGDIYLATRKFALATHEYQKAVEIKQRGPEIYVKLAKAYRGQGTLDAALAMLRLATAKESGFPEIYREYGLVYEQKGMADEAISNFQQYLRLEPNPPDKQQILDKINNL